MTCEMLFVKRGTLNNKNNSPHLKRKYTNGVKPNSIPQEKNIFAMNKGQSSKGKPSFDNTCFFYKKCGHWEDDCELKQTIKHM